MLAASQGKLNSSKGSKGINVAKSSEMLRNSSYVNNTQDGQNLNVGVQHSAGNGYSNVPAISQSQIINNK